MKHTLYVLRHGHVDAAGRLLGQTDVALSEKGQQQARYWQDTLQAISFGAVWVSPLQRAVQTAEICLEHRHPKLAIQKISAFAEIALGVWDGQAKTWIQDKYRELWRERGEKFDVIAPPDGESFIDLERRVMPAFFAVCQQARRHEASLVVAHQAVNRVILSHVLGVPLLELHTLPQDYACLNIFDITGGATEGVIYEAYLPCPI